MSGNPAPCAVPSSRGFRCGRCTPSFCKLWFALCIQKKGHATHTRKKAPAGAGAERGPPPMGQPTAGGTTPKRRKQNPPLSAGPSQAGRTEPPPPPGTTNQPPLHRRTHRRTPAHQRTRHNTAACPIGGREEGRTGEAKPHPRPKDAEADGHPRREEIQITGWTHKPTGREHPETRTSPRQGRGLTPARTTAGWQQQRQRPAGPPGKAPTNPPTPTGAAGRGADGTDHARTTRRSAGRDPRPRDSPPATTPTNSTDGAGVYFASAPLGGADSRPPTGDATTAAAYERSEFART